MINETLYNKTVNILVDAYFNDTLRHNICCACAVGNIVSANLNISMLDLKRMDENNRGGANPLRGWGAVFCSDHYFKHQRISPEAYIGEAKKQIDSTGYTWQQLAKIECAFEFATKEGGWMFNGLMAVIDVLDEIHENNNTELTATTKLKFQKVCKV